MKCAKKWKWNENFKIMHDLSLKCCQVASVVSNSVWPHRRQPTRLCHPWDSPGKNSGVGCHFLLQCMKVKRENEVTQSSPAPSYPMDCSLSGSSIHGIFQVRVLEWVAIVFSFFKIIQGILKKIFLEEFYVYNKI